MEASGGLSQHVILFVCGHYQDQCETHEQASFTREAGSEYTASWSWVQKTNDKCDQCSKKATKAGQTQNKVEDYKDSYVHKAIPKGMLNQFQSDQTPDLERNFGAQVPLEIRNEEEDAKPDSKRTKENKKGTRKTAGKSTPPKRRSRATMNNKQTQEPTDGFRVQKARSYSHEGVIRGHNLDFSYQVGTQEHSEPLQVTTTAVQAIPQPSPTIYGQGWDPRHYEDSSSEILSSVSTPGLPYHPFQLTSGSVYEERVDPQTWAPDRAINVGQDTPYSASHTGLNILHQNNSNINEEVSQFLRYQNAGDDPTLTMSEEEVEFWSSPNSLSGI